MAMATSILVAPLSVVDRVYDENCGHVRRFDSGATKVYKQQQEQFRGRLLLERKSHAGRSVRPGDSPDRNLEHTLIGCCLFLSYCQAVTRYF